MLDEDHDEWLLMEDRLAGRLPPRGPFETPLEEAGRMRRSLARRGAGLVHREPLPRGARPSLLTRLERAPRTDRVHPFENQVSETLGFLVDHDARFASDFSGLLWSPGRPPDPFWPTQASEIGAFSGGTLPGAGLAPVLYPDISICGSERSFQILVEVKVTADFHGYPDRAGELVLQPDAYVLGWEAASGQLPVGRRRVATIAPKAPPGRVPSHAMRGSDLLWEADVIPLLLECAARRGPIGELVGAVALDLATAVRERLAPPPNTGREPSAELVGLLLDWRPHLVEALRHLESRHAGALAPGRVSASSDYLGAYLSLTTPYYAQPARIWVFLTTADGKYNRVDQPQSACVCLWEPGPKQSPALYEALQGPLAHVDARLPDRTAETASRVYRPLSAFSSASNPSQALADWIEGVLTGSALLVDGSEA